MNRSEIEATMKTVLSENASSNGMSSRAFACMPMSYEPGSTETNATMFVVFQKQESQLM